MTASLLACATLTILVAGQNVLRAGEESLPPIVGGRTPTNLDELWGTYDPGKEALDTQVVREWTEGGITLRHVVFTVGTFKGRVSRLAAFYGFPTGRQKLPGIVDIHGGGGSANLTPVRNAAANGYAGLSINWNGNAIEKMQDGDANTDWGAIDPSQKHNDHYYSMKPDAKTLDAVDSPRNNNWFLLVLAARRSLTFLEHQPEVDAQRLGVTGHSMGGKITTDVAGIDRRIKAAVPSCGGAGSVSGKLSGMPGAAGMAGNPLALATVEDEAYLPRITCPILFLSPTNDFAGPFDNMTVNWTKIPGTTTVAHAIAPHLNHHHIAETTLTSALWFDQHLKQSFTVPRAPTLDVELAGPGGIPRVTVTADHPDEVARVDVFYAIDPSCIFRFWRDAQATGSGAVWTAACPVMSVDQPLFVFANVVYRLEKPGSDQSVKPPATYLVSSREAIYLPKELQAAGVKATDRPTRMIDDFARGWHDWYQLEWGNPHWWEAATRKLKDAKWHGPAGARLVVEVICPKDNVLAMEMNVNEWNVYPGRPGGTYKTFKPLKGSPDWQTVTVTIEDLQPDKADQKPMTGWDTITRLAWRWSKTFRQDGKEVAFGDGRTGWPAQQRQFRNLRWEGGAYTGATVDTNTVGVPTDLDGAIQGEIRKSIDQEKREKKP